MTRIDLAEKFRQLCSIAALAAVLLAAAGVLAQEAAPTVQPPARIAVSPGKFEVPIDAQGAVESMKVINFGAEPVQIRISVAPWDLDENSRVRHVEPTEQSLDQWMMINPRTFTIDGQSEQTVRFSIRPRTRPEDGEHRAMIYFEEVPKEPTEATPVQVRFKLGVAVYAYAGDVEHRGHLAAVRAEADAENLTVGFDIDSVGNAHVRMVGQYAIWPVDAFPGVDAVEPYPDMDKPEFVAPAPVLLAGLLPNTPVLGGTRRELALGGGHGLEAGRYVLSAVGSLGDDEFRRAIEFEVPAPTVTAESAEQTDRESGSDDRR